MTLDYYHGTCVADAVNDLIGGGPLRPRRPDGESKVRAANAAREGFVYLTPSFHHACEYAYPNDRADWPEFHEVEHCQPHVFKFDLSGATLFPEEDDLGWAACVARDRLAGKCGGLGTHNLVFMERIAEDRTTLAWLLDEAERLLGRDVLTKAATAKRGTMRVGARLAPRLDPALSEALVGLGISVACADDVRPNGAWTWGRGTHPSWKGGSGRCPDGLPPVQGAWCDSPASSTRP
jgi:hypothetical protein